jgi:hypothetical protein
VKLFGHDKGKAIRAKLKDKDFFKKTIVVPSFGLNGFNAWSFRPGPKWL